MDIMKTFSRIGLGLLLIACSFGLFYNKAPASHLPGYLEALSKVFIFSKYLIPYSLVYYNVNAALFGISGLFALVNSPFAPNFYLGAATMFCITFDNPLLAKQESEKYLRYLFLVCHFCIYFCLSVFAEEKEAADKKARKVQKQREQAGKKED